VEKNGKTTLKTDELADLIMVSPRRIQQLSRGGTIPRTTPRGPFELVTSVQAYIRHIKEGVGEVEIDGESHEQARTRLTKARADIHQRTALQLSGDLIPSEQVESNWQAVLSIVRQSLISLPDRVAPRVNDAETLNETRQLLKEGVYEILEELAETKIEWDTQPKGTGTPVPTGDSIKRSALPKAPAKSKRK